MRFLKAHLKFNRFSTYLVPKSPPEGIACQGVTSAGIELKWDLLSAEKLRGKLTSYKIHYQEASALDLKDSKLTIFRPCSCTTTNFNRTFEVSAKGYTPVKMF